MKIAVAYNSPASRVLQRRGTASYEAYPQQNIDRIADALRANGHEVVSIEGDRHLADHLEEFFGPTREDVWPGLVFNLAFGVQGELRYCHVPAMLEMLGLPYIGSGPMGHALATDKAAAKAVFLHDGLPTPDFVEIHAPDFTAPDLPYPLVVKPVCGASSLGLQFVNNEQELRTAVLDDLRRFAEPVLVEQFVPGREIGIGIIGNDPPEMLPPLEVVLGPEGPPVYTRADKDGDGGRRMELLCPAPVSDRLAARARELALAAFVALDCRDWARVELRIDDRGDLQLLEVNTIPGIGEISSMRAAARVAGMEDLAALVQRLVEVATARYRVDARAAGSATPR